MTLNELQLLSRIKDKPCLYLGRRSLVGLRGFLFGVRLGMNVCGERSEESEPSLPLFEAFIDGYSQRLWQREGKNGYVCWWNYMLYVSCGDDSVAFDQFFRTFEQWLREERGLDLPEPDSGLPPYLPEEGERKE